ncbi:MAG: hypothetical protein EON56_03135 [Alphaproteobacteria bacterium]|nr:MAG: hypothetical protein EON56_03135 [Alphaproteobacteria bacterium]
MNEEYERESLMETSNLRHETRDAVLVAIARDMIARTSMSQDGFAEQLNHQLIDRAPARCKEKGFPDLQALTKTADMQAYGRAYKAWSKRVERWLDDSGDRIEIPSWIEESWVAALDQPWRDRALTELASRYGLLAVKQIGSGVDDALQVFAGIATNFGLVAGLGGKVFADGVFDQKDHMYAESFESFCRSLAAHAVAMADQASLIASKLH